MYVGIIHWLTILLVTPKYVNIPSTNANKNAYMMLISVRIVIAILKDISMYDIMNVNITILEKITSTGYSL